MPKILSHRCSHFGAETGMEEAIKKALEKNIDGIELDISLTKERKMVIFHDEDVSRFLPESKEITELEYKKLKLFLDILKVEEVLSLVDGKFLIKFDLKAPVRNELLSLLKNYDGDVLIYMGGRVQDYLFPLLRFWNKARSNKIKVEIAEYLYSFRTDSYIDGVSFSPSNKEIKLFKEFLYGRKHADIYIDLDSYLGKKTIKKLLELEPAYITLHGKIDYFLFKRVYKGALEEKSNENSKHLLL